MACEVVTIHGFAEPFLHHRRVDVVVVSPSFVAGVVGWVNVDALHPAGVGGQQRLQRLEVVAVDDEIVVQPHLVREAPVPLRHQFVILDREMIILDERFPLEIECGHRVGVVARATATTGNLKIEGARTQRALPRGTAKRLSNEHAKPRPMGRVLGRSFDGLGKLAVFEAARSRSYAKLFCKNYSIVFFVHFGRGELYSEMMVQDKLANPC